MQEVQLVEMGTHDELLTLDGLYAKLRRSEEAIHSSASASDKVLLLSYYVICCGALFVLNFGVVFPS